MKLYVIIAVLAAYFAFCGYIINDGIYSIRVNSFKLGCMSVAAPHEAIEACRAQAEKRFKQ